MEWGRDEGCRTHVRDIGGWNRRGAGNIVRREATEDHAHRLPPCPILALQQRVVDLSLHGDVAEIRHMNTYLGNCLLRRHSR